jgi:hypothetical protein
MKTYRGKKHNIWGTELTLRQWSERMGINLNTVRSRIYRGWDVEDAVMFAVRMPHNRKRHVNTEKVHEVLFSALLASQREPTFADSCRPYSMR